MFILIRYKLILIRPLTHNASQAVYLSSPLFYVHPRCLAVTTGCAAVRVKKSLHLPASSMWNVVTYINIYLLLIVDHTVFLWIDYDM